MLVGHPVPEGAQVVAEVQITARLHPGQDPGHGVPWYGTRAWAWCWRHPGVPVATGGWQEDDVPAHGPCTDNDGAAGRVAIVVAHVSTPVFEGPFDVLLQLVSDHKVDIYEIRLSDLVDAFIAEMTARQPFDVQTASEFLVIAAILVELKSRKLPRARRRRGRRRAGRIRRARPPPGPPPRAPGLRGRR